MRNSIVLSLKQQKMFALILPLNVKNQFYHIRI